VDPIGGEWYYEYDGLGTGGGRTLLHDAAQYGNVEAISVLMEFGTDLYRRDETMKTALQIAVELGEVGQRGETVGGLLA
jgi:ankyrin repeat protein